MKTFDKIFGGLISVAAVLASAGLSAQAQGNLLVDPTFSSPITLTPPIEPATVGQGWASINGTASGTSQGISTYSGNPAYQVTMGASDAWDFTGPYQAVGAGVNGVTITPGQTYMVTASFLTTTGFGAGEPNWSGNNAVGAYLQVEFNSDTAGLPQVGSTASINNTGAGLLLGNWYYMSFTAVAPAGASVAEVYLAFMEDGKQTVPEQVYFGNASLAAVPEPASLALLALGLPLFFAHRRR